MRRYNENRDCALEERNFNRNVSDVETQESHWLYRNIERCCQHLSDSNRRYGRRDQNNDVVGDGDSANHEWTVGHC